MSDYFIDMVEAQVGPKVDSWFYLCDPSDLSFTVFINKDSKRISCKFDVEEVLSITPEELLSRLGLIEEELKPIEKIRRTTTACPNCGANSWIDKSCAYCGTEII